MLCPMKGMEAVVSTGYVLCGNVLMLLSRWMQCGMVGAVAVVVKGDVQEINDLFVADAQSIVHSY